MQQNQHLPTFSQIGDQHPRSLNPRNDGADTSAHTGVHPQPPPHAPILPGMPLNLLPPMFSQIGDHHPKSLKHSYDGADYPAHTSDQPPIQGPTVPIVQKYWALTSDTRIGSEIDNEIRKKNSPKQSLTSLPYPENPIIKQYSAEYWILGDLLKPEEQKGGSFAKRVLDYREADVIFVPFFTTLSAELQLVVDKGVFRKRVEENEDYVRQKMVVDLVKKV